MVNEKGLYRTAHLLAVVTILYNLGEGLVSVFFGVQDETIALLGFGIDSFVEVISGVGIWHMTRRIMQHEDESPDAFERRALKTTGTAFYLLAAGLVLTAGLNLYRGSRPDTTFWGIVIAAVSIATMGALYALKMKTGRAVGSKAVIADAHCTRACIYLSVVLLLASAGYEATGIGGLDALGALLIALLSFNEGREAFEKAAGGACACG